MAKHKVKNKRPSKKWLKYTVAGEKLERKTSCPKCGPPFFFAKHKDRLYCGKCHFVQMTSSS